LGFAQWRISGLEGFKSALKRLFMVSPCQGIRREEKSPEGLNLLFEDYF
jgi:hypothetical protein